MIAKRSAETFPTGYLAYLEKAKTSQDVINHHPQFSELTLETRYTEIAVDQEGAKLICLCCRVFFLNLAMCVHVFQ